MTTGSVGPSDADRYQWPGAAEGSLSMTSTRIARHLARTKARVIGLLPVDDRLGPPERLAPVLFRIADALTGFLAGDLAIIDAWRTWPWGEALSAGDPAAARGRALGPRILEIAPPPCGDAGAAAMALQNTLAGLPERAVRVLVNLGGYGPAGIVPLPVEWMDGVVLVAAARRSRQAAVTALAAHIPTEKGLGAILIG